MLRYYSEIKSFFDLTVIQNWTGEIFEFKHTGDIPSPTSFKNPRRKENRCCERSCLKAKKICHKRKLTKYITIS